MLYLEELIYDCTSPSGLRWKENHYGGKGRVVVCAGDVAGTLGKDGYWRINSVNYLVLAHTVVWELHFGLKPDDMTLDHIDGDSSLNVIENLRLVTHAINCRNRKSYGNNSTGFNGVSYFEPKNRSARYTASWRTLDGSLRSKSFSVSRYGSDEALRLAVEYRNKQIEILNTFGAGYSERHGEII